MSKHDEPDVEVRPNSENPSDSGTTPTSNKSQKTRTTKQTDRILIFNKEE